MYLPLGPPDGSISLYPLLLKLHNIVNPEINTEVIKRVYATNLILFFLNMFMIYSIQCFAEVRNTAQTGVLDSLTFEVEILKSKSMS